MHGRLSLVSRPGNSPWHGRPARATGFTLVELLAATALSLLLVLACLAVLRSIRRAAAVANDLGADWTAAVGGRLRWDLANAVVVRQDARGLLLGGYGSRDGSTGEPTHRPVVVTYSVQTIGGRRWLVRDQAGLDPLAHDRGTTDLVAGDVGSFAVTMPPEQPTPADADDPTPLVFRQLPGFRRLPDGLRLRLTAEGGAAFAADVTYAR